MKIYGRESANSDFPCAKLQNMKKIHQNLLLAIMKKNPENILINSFSPIFVPNLVTLA